MRSWSDTTLAGGTKPGAVAQQALRRAARAQRWGVVAIVVHQESARVLASHHAGGRRTNFRVKEERRLVNHYSDLRDREYGEGFVRISSYPPFQTRIWLNAHGYLTAQLQRRGIPVLTADNCIVSVADPVTLPRIAAQFDARLVEQIARRWLGWVPDPLTPAERAQGYPTRLSIYQAEFSDNGIVHRTQVLNRVYEELLRDHPHLGRPDILQVIFDRQIRGHTPSPFKTRVLRQGVVSCLKVFYLRNEVDLALVGGRPVEDGRLVVEPYVVDELVLVVPPTHPWARRRRILPEDLRQEPLILREVGSATRWVMEEAFRLQGIPYQVGMELGQTEAIKGAVAAGLGVTILSRFAVAHEVACGTLAVARLEGVSLTRDFFLVRLKEKRQSAVALAFREVLEDERAAIAKPSRGKN